ncbi:hypothetical protein H6P81_009392 [Aristolochia fimbriata]|uniref:Integrase zinc-binding domain-containing protein n=1 Tax=Aristolochia fimbriata TaxID=158543 RepID=A0AAV7EP80_ARIFI|nr:hypothetical protein H6P81_009392 [Aristolochia fimbriata]
MQPPQLNIYGDFGFGHQAIVERVQVKKLELEPLGDMPGELRPKSRKFHSTMSLAPRMGQPTISGIAASLARRRTAKPNTPGRPPRASPNSSDSSSVRFHQRHTLPGRDAKVRSFRRLSKEEGLQVLKETHGGISRAHIKLAQSSTYRSKDFGYYWPTMLGDAIEMARTCKPCQLHADYIHQPPVPLHPTVASWPFKAWGMDIIGPITPKSDSTAIHLGCHRLFLQMGESCSLPRGQSHHRRRLLSNSNHIQIWNSTVYRGRTTAHPSRIKSWTASAKNFAIQQRMSPALQPGSQWTRRGLQ